METVRKQTRTQADPVEGELAAINALGNTSLTAEEVYPFGVRLCDNQTDRDLEYFARADLEQLAELFVGKTGIFDHSWSAKDQRARIYRTELVEEPGVVTEAGEPGCYLKGYAYMLRTAENAGLIAEIEGGIKKEVSVSCEVRRQVCSICGHDIHDRGQCSHGKGQVYGEKRCIVRLAEPTDAFEWSFVAVPAQPRAGVVKRFGSEGTELRTLRKQAELGQRYLTGLRREVVRLAMLADGHLDGKIFTKAVGRLDEAELLELKRAYEAQIAKKFPVAPQLRQQAETKREDEAVFHV